MDLFYKTHNSTSGINSSDVLQHKNDLSVQEYGFVYYQVLPNVITRLSNKLKKCPDHNLTNWNAIGAQWLR